MNSGQPPPSKLKLPGSGGGTNSVAIRIGLVAAGLIVLVIIFSVVRGLLSGDSNKPLFVAVVQDQQELVHLTTGVTSKQDISTSNSNFASTANLSLKTAQQDMITYMTNLGIKGVDPKVLALQVNPKTDKQLADAAVASTYNETFREIMKTELASYKQDLQAAYNKTDGPKGRKLLADQFRQAELLEIQLGETIN